jgi:hypothetical protein
MRCWRLTACLNAASPVDTGRFRASWQVGENAAGTYDAGPQQEATGAYKDQTEPPGNQRHLRYAG